MYSYHYPRCRFVSNPFQNVETHWLALLGLLIAGVTVRSFLRRRRGRYCEMMQRNEVLAKKKPRGMRGKCAFVVAYIMSIASEFM